MNKILVLLAALLLVASTCFAAAEESGIIDFDSTGLELFGDDDTAGNDVRIGKTSTGVSIAWQTSETAYALMTQHKNGTKAYGSSYDSTAIYQTAGSVKPGTAAYNGGELTQSDTTDFEADEWSAM